MATTEASFPANDELPKEMQWYIVGEEYDRLEGNNI